MNNWDKTILTEMYKTMTLQDIGDYFGVTRERIRQIMERFNIPRDKHREHTRLREPKYKNLEDYLRNKNHHPYRDDLTTARRFLPEDAFCSECKSTKNIILHHIKYPAQSLDDIQLLCKSCHTIKHKGKMSYIRQLSLYNDYIFGIHWVKLAKKYSISGALVYRIIDKIKNNRHALKR